MPTFEYEGITIEVDDEGYLLNFDVWNERSRLCAGGERRGEPGMSSEHGAN